MKVSAIIVAGGSSRRMGFDKLAADLAGRSVLSHSLAAFQDCEEIAEMILVGSNDPLSENPPTKLKTTVLGGAERHLSVAAGLDAISADTTHIAVHDGARPLITPAAITICIKAAATHQAASLAHPITDTLKRATDQTPPTVTDSVSRDNLWAMETPQIFEAALLREAYKNILATDAVVTDEVSAVENLGHKVVLVENPSPNPKVTFPADIPLCEALLSLKTEN
jgi:2-C-methyl-D-erythritol 4-phosphate cytidylyltransferase